LTDDSANVISSSVSKWHLGMPPWLQAAASELKVQTRHMDTPDSHEADACDARRTPLNDAPAASLGADEQTFAKRQTFGYIR
jgi:hypothetical protein